ncbi:unnamed protein product [Psylliodes chrysocephalus]|uniref:Uncharacterized protein n=1 Tax=Psylliodes chrysocephalus TaxID=3402493 RepID=A0A9P0CR86_9CUCU|nr:unnamed protein product [Psylliodes chrysocephala]
MSSTRSKRIMDMVHAKEHEKSKKNSINSRVNENNGVEGVTKQYYYNTNKESTNNDLSVLPSPVFGKELPIFETDSPSKFDPNTDKYNSLLEPVGNTLQSKTMDATKNAEHNLTISYAVAGHKRSAEKGSEELLN